MTSPPREGGGVHQKVTRGDMRGGGGCQKVTSPLKNFLFRYFHDREAGKKKFLGGVVHQKVTSLQGEGGHRKVTSSDTRGGSKFQNGGDVIYERPLRLSRRLTKGVTVISNFINSNSISLRTIYLRTINQDAINSNLIEIHNLKLLQL